MAMVSLARSRMSRPVRGARIEIVRTPAVGRRRASRPVRGARIEIPLSCGCGSCGKSRPARGARIEIPVEDHGHWLITCRAPQGARGLKCGRCHRLSGRGARRAPQGARGLKCRWARRPSLCRRSRPARGARIEIHMGKQYTRLYGCRAPQGARGLKWMLGVDLYLSRTRRAPQGARGLKSRFLTPGSRSTTVAPRKGRED